VTRVLPDAVQGKLFVSDLDGTLLRPDRTLGQRSRRVLQRLIDDGGLFTVATGRGIGSTAEVLRGLHLPLGAILHNGALTARLDSGAIARIDPLAEDAAGVLFARALALDLTPTAYALPRGSADATQTMVFHGPRPNRPTLAYLDSVRPHHACDVDHGAGLREMQVLSLIVLDHPQRIDELFSGCVDLELTLCSGASAYTPGLGVGEITGRTASKRTAAAALAASLGLDLGRVVAFGDNANDLPLLLAAGQAFCPTDAPERVQRQIAGRIPAPRDEGVAAYFEQLMPG